jgi:hypothetical protein
MSAKIIFSVDLFGQLFTVACDLWRNAWSVQFRTNCDPWLNSWSKWYSKVKTNSMTVCGPWVLSQYYSHYMKPSQYWWELHAWLPAVCKDSSHSHLSGHGSSQAKPKPGQSQCLWLGLRIPEAKATQSQARTSLPRIELTRWDCKKVVQW